MRKCTCGRHIKHIVCFRHFPDTEIIEAPSGLSDSCILCSQNVSVFISRFDWNRLPTAELERHDLQHGRDNKNIECQRIHFVHTTDCAYKCVIKCLVQTTVAPPS